MAGWHHRLDGHGLGWTLGVGDVIQPSHPLSSPSPPAFQSFPALGSFLMSQLISLGGQTIGVSASASVLPLNIQD